METRVTESVFMILHCDLFSSTVHYVTHTYYRCVRVCAWETQP